VFRWGLGRNPKGIYPFRLGRWFESENFVYFVNIICISRSEGKDGTKEGIHEIMCGHSTLSTLSHN